MANKIQKLVYASYGDPQTALSLVEASVPTELKQGEAHVKVLLSPVNPADVMSVNGHYALKPPLPAVPGLEGVAEVVKSSSGIFAPGDRVLVTKPGWGLWQQQGVVEERFLVKLPKELALEAAATLVVNPVTAYIMVKHVVALKAGDVLIQNAANSALGQIVIQLCKAAGIKTINVIRNRPNLQDTVDILTNLGADFVITDEQLKQGLSKLNLGVDAPKLALECIGGSAANDLASSLAHGGTVAVYGVLSGKPAEINQGLLIFNDIRVVGVWLSKWIDSHTPAEFGAVLGDVIEHYVSGKLQLPRFRKFPLEQWRDAITTATKGYTNEKILIQLN